MKIGFIGLGIMGTPMCANILKKKAGLGVHNRTKQKADALSEMGAKFFDSPKALYEWADATILMLPDDNAVMDVVNQISPKSKILVNMSTISPDLAKELTKKSKKDGFEFANANVSGSKKPAEEGNLVVLYGGKKETLQKLRDVFDAVGKATVYAGSQEDAAKLKLLVNFLLGGMMGIFAESIATCEKIGLDKRVFLQAIESGPLMAPYFKTKVPNILSNDFPPAFMTKYMLKDLKYLEQAVRKNGQEIKTNIIELFEEANKKYPNEDLSSIYKTLSKKF